jgi:DNA mismatch endonuclease (patch repair protein)
MSRLRRRDNGPELAVRRLLYARIPLPRGLRIPGQRRRTIDIAFIRARLAVYMDGCLWHSCPDNQHMPKANAARWVQKMEMNRARDAAATAQLQGLAWTVLRFWEHEAPEDVAGAVAAHLVSRPTARRQIAARSS